MDLKPQKNDNLVCEYCGKSYTKPSAFEVHVCTKKQRALQHNEKRVRYGHHAFNRFNKLSAGKSREYTYAEFCESPYYNAFVKFGSYMSNVRPIYPDKYVDYIVTSGKKINQWCDESLYEQYIVETVQKENPELAIKRTIDYMIDWATANSSIWNHYFDHVTSDQLMWDIRDGKVSPWLLLNCNKGRRLLSSLEDSQLNVIYAIIEPNVWKSRFKRNPESLELIHELAKQYNL